MLRALEHLFCEEKLRDWCFLNLEKRWLWGHLAAPQTYEELIEKTNQ